MARNPLQTGDDSGNPLSLAPWQIGDPTDPMAVAGAQNTVAADPLAQWLARIKVQQQISADRGLWTGGQFWEGGHPTMAGVRDAIGQTGTAVALGTGGATERPTVFYRNTRGPVDMGAGYMMYADNPEAVAHYGKNKYVADTAKIPPREIVDASSPDFQKSVENALRDRPDLLSQHQATAKKLASEVAPPEIVNSAGIWDAPDLVEHLWNTVLDPKGYTAVRTPNGLISFDPAHAELQIPSRK